MHTTAMQSGKEFFTTYYNSFSDRVKVVEIGSQNVNGSLKEACPVEAEYVGLDFQKANGVDIVLTDAYSFPLENNSVDIVVSSSCFEHSELFWLSYLEIMRILKPKGLFYLCAPTVGAVHKYPVDCWRFYPDAGKALITWGKRNNINNILLESYVQQGGGWDDFVAVFLKDETYSDQFLQRIVDTKSNIGHKYKK
jgi:SAM-dependent methyltransferase